jgi:subtilisin family serine protease
VLAVGLQPQAMTRIRQLGFDISDTSLEQEQGTVLTLYPPDGLGALRSIALLRRELPRESFYLNRIYRPYNTATEDPNEMDRAPPSKPDVSGKCTGDRCFGRAAIGWGDRLADCARGVNVGVIDTDVDLAHPAFAGQKITRKAFLSEGKKSSGKGHGTSVLALLAGERDSSTPGLIPRAQFFFADIFFTDENGDTITDTVSLLKALQWMESSQTRVVNMSFSGPEDELVQVRLKAMRARGMAFTAAAGNQGPAAAPSYPAAYSEVIAVTAVDKNMRVYPFANRGPYVDVAAPGVKIWTAVAGAREEYRTGTSFAAPFVTAIIAVQQSNRLNEDDEQLLDHIQTEELGPQGRDQIYGRGLLKAPQECSNDVPIAVSAPGAKERHR